jgi:hypothetical protein
MSRRFGYFPEDVGASRVIKIVSCYAQRDAALVAELQQHLLLLQQQNKATLWHPGEIMPGDNRAEALAQHIDEADIILLLLSAHFLSSASCYDEQLQRAMDRHRRAEARMIPILLRAVDYTGTQFKDVQALPKGGRPVYRHGDREDAWAEIAREIRTAIEAVSAKVQQAEPDSAARWPGARAEVPSRGAQPRASNPGHLPWLEARFRRDGTDWHVELAPETERVRKRRFREPRRVEALFMAMFDEDQDADLFEYPWRLRLRPKELEGDAELPCSASSWVHLRHPEDDCHLLDRGWTVTELTVRPMHVECSGTIAVIGGDELFRALLRLLGPRVVRGAHDDLPGRALVVVQGATAPGDVQRIQESAQRAECALVIWGDPIPVPRSSLVEVLTLQPTKERLASWLVRFLSRLLTGIDPERAFAFAGLGGPREDRAGRWLRGAVSSWRVDPPESAVALDPRWFVRLDRSRQESEVNRLTHTLVLPNNKRRIQVIISAGPAGSGLELFCHRPPLISPEMPRIPVAEWDLTWTEAPALQAQRLLQRLKARRGADLPERLLAEAARFYEQQVGVRGTRVLFWGRHETACLEASDGLRHVTLDDLRSYLDELCTLSVHLARWDMRVLLHLPFQGATDRDLESLQRNEAHFKVNVLPTLPAGIPADELRSWLDDAGLHHDQQSLDEMMNLSYDNLIQWLVQRYPELRSI